MERSHLTEHRIRFQMISVQLERIGMQEQAVSLREINGYGLIGSKRIFRQFFVTTIIPLQHVLIDGVGKLYINESLTKSLVAIVKQAVSCKLFSLIGQDRTIQ